MWVDLLHSFYSMPINIWIGGTLYPATIRWYKAPATAKQFPLPTVFFSHVDDSVGDAWPGEPGELGSPRTFDRGVNPGYQGQCYIGDPQWFLTGQLPASVLNPPAQPLPCLCSIPPAAAAGGLVVGGSAAAFRGVTSCVNCPTGAPPAWSATSGGGTGNYAGANGVFRVAYFTLCTWQGPGDGITTPFFFVVNTNDGTGWHLRLTLNNQQAQYSPVGAFQCMGKTTWSVVVNPGGAPPFITTDPTA